MNNQSSYPLGILPQFGSPGFFQQNAGVQVYTPPYYSPAILVPEFDSTGCINELLRLYPGLTLQDVLRSCLNVVYLSDASVKIILEALLPNCTESGHFLHDFIYHYCFKDPKFLPHMKRCWFATDGRHGYGVLSLVQVIREGRTVDAFKFVAKCLGINVSADNVAQCESYPGYAYIPESHAYPGSCHNLTVDYLLGPLSKQYWFCTDNGLPSFCLREWQTKRGPVRLFVTLQQERLTGELVWEFIAPPPEYLIYNRDLIDKYGSSKVYIHDQISRVDLYGSQDQEVHTWAGDLSISSHIDWSCCQSALKIDPPSASKIDPPQAVVFSY